MRANIIKTVFVSGLAIFSVIGGGASLSGCNGDGVSPVDLSDYFLQFYMIRDMQRDSSAIRAYYRRDGNEIPSGPLHVDTMQLGFSAAKKLHIREYNTVNGIDTGVHTIVLGDQGDTVASTSVTMADTFTITVADPASRIYTGGMSVVVDFTPSANAQGYLVAAIKAGSEHTNSGYSAFVPFISSTGVLPPSVFRDSLTNNLDTGLYYIYMYAYRGSPQIDTFATELPTALPDTGFTPNLSIDNLTGSIGTIVVSRRDSVFVQEQP